MGSRIRMDTDLPGSDGVRPTDIPAAPWHRWAAMRVGLAVGVTTAACAVLMAWRLGAKSLWLDESLSVAWSRLSLPELLRQAPGEPNMNLYYVLLKAWAPFGSSES